MKTKKLLRAKKTFKFWFKVLLGTNLMDDPNHRKEYIEALASIKKKQKKTAI
jgi:hypothetical protein